MKNFKKRWFRLTNHEFTYQKSKGNEKKLAFSFFSLTFIPRDQALCKSHLGFPSAFLG